MTDAWPTNPSEAAPSSPSDPAASEPAASPSTQPAEPAPEAAATAPAAPAVETPAEPAAPSLKVGAIVRHAWEDPTGEHEAFGMVAEVNTDGDTPRASIVWFSGRSGLIPADDLEVLEEG